MRIGGIASGMDTEQMVQDLMRAESMRLNKYTREQEALTWKREAFNTTNKKLAEFILAVRKDFGLTKTTSSGTIVSSSKNSFDWVKTASVSNESVLTATASANAMSGTHKIEVENLAEGASVTSKDISHLIGEDGKFIDENGDPITSSDISISTSSGTATFTIGTADGEIDNINDLVKEISNAEDANGNALGLRAAYDKDLGKLMINTKDQGKEQFISIGGTLKDDFIDASKGVEAKEYNLGDLTGDVSFTLDGTTLNLTDPDTDDLINAINTDADLGKDFYAYKSGEELVIESLNGKNIDLSSGAINTEELITIQDSGTDAKINFNGETIEKPSNNFSIYGVNYQLKSADPGTEITVNVDTNVEGMMEKITGFVDKYNELIDEINGKLGEKEYRDYQPLISEEKEAMTEKEIELWEEKAKSGLLKNDATLTRTLQSMRSGLYGSVYTDGSNTQNKDNLLPGFSHITQIGITTGNYQSGGKLEIDENKLRAAINDNPEGVVDLLFKTSDTEVKEGEDDYNDKKAKHSAESGLVNRLFGDMISGMQEVVRISGTGEDASLFRDVKSNMLIDFVTGGSMSKIDKNIMNIGDRIAREERLLSSKESRYWSEFTAMEKAMEKMNQQSGWLMSQLGQMG